MSDNDLILRGEALEALDWGDIYGRNAQAAIAALPAAKMVQEARDQAFRDAAKAAGDAAVEVLLRHIPDANLLTQQARRQSVAVPVLRLIGTPHPEVAKDDE